MRSFIAKSLVIFLMLLLAATFSVQLLAQSSAGTLRGKLTDPSGAVIAQGTVTVTSATGQKFTATTKGDGSFELKDLPAGKYTMQATAKGFSPAEQADLDIVAGQLKVQDVALDIEVEKQTVEVEDQSNQVEVSASNNATQLVLKGADLDALSDDPDELQEDLMALAGPAAGPNGGQIYIDGFSGGQLPPKSSIREIRINSNPFSAQYDRLGFGRIEVFTKPGTESYHGQFMFNFNNKIFNSRNPYQLAPEPGLPDPGYHTEMYRGNFTGPITKKSSFSLSASRRNMNETSIVNATVLDINDPGTLSPIVNPNPQRYTPAVPNPRIGQSISPRFDYQVSQNNTLTVRYQWESSKTENGGVGGFSLPFLATNSDSTEHNITVSDTQVLNTSTINETRFQYDRESSNRYALNDPLLPSVSVAEAFNAGGSSSGSSIDKSDHFELQNYTSKVAGKHFVKFGGRLRYNRDLNDGNSGYNGSYTFTSLTAYYIAQLGLQGGLTPAMTRATCLAYLGSPEGSSPTSTPWPDSLPLPTVDSDCGARQFKLTTGSQFASVGQYDAGLYLEDDWRVKPNFTLSYGVRFETQSNVDDHVDFAPRIGFAWGLGKGTAPKTVLRAGIGMFYDRFSQGTVMQVRRSNGVIQQNYIVENPDFYPTVPDPSTLTPEQNNQPTTYQIDPNLKIPYTIQSAITVERQLSRAANVAVSYITSRGLHQLVTENLNAPLADGTRPLGDIGNVYQYQSAGTFKQNQLMTNLNLRLGRYLSLNGYYSLSYANSNVAGRGAGFPTIPFNLNADWGRASFDTRHRGMIMGNISLPYGFRLSPMVMMSSGSPINITTGTDVNGDSIINDRPSFADPATCALATLPLNIRNTRWGCFDMTPAPGATIIPINYVEGPGQINTNLRISKTFTLGGRREATAAQQGAEASNSARMIGMAAGRGGRGGGRGGHGGPGGGMGGWGGGSSSGGRYSLTFSASARNVLNHVNPGTPSGNLSSIRFGQSYSLSGGGFGGAANRRLDFQVMFNF